MGYGANPEVGAPRARGRGASCRASQGREARGMAMITDASLALETEAEAVAFAREVLRIEAQALERVRGQLGLTMARAADLVYRCPGSVIVTGMGKAGLVGQKLAATLAST